MKKLNKPNEHDEKQRQIDSDVGKEKKSLFVLLIRKNSTIDILKEINVALFLYMNENA